MSPSYPTSGGGVRGFQDPLHRILSTPFNPSGPGGHREPLPRYLREKPIRQKWTRPPVRVPNVLPKPGIGIGIPELPRGLMPLLVRGLTTNPYLRGGMYLLDILSHMPDPLDTSSQAVEDVTTLNGYLYRGECNTVGTIPKKWFWVSVGSNQLVCLTGQAQFSQNFVEGTRPKWLHRFYQYNVTTGLDRSRSRWKYERIDTLPFRTPWNEGLPWKDTSPGPTTPGPQPDHGRPTQTQTAPLPQHWEKPYNPFNPDTFPIQRPTYWRPQKPYRAIPHAWQHPENVRENTPDPVPGETPDSGPSPGTTPGKPKPFFDPGFPAKNPFVPKPKPIPTVQVQPGRPNDNTPQPHIKVPAGPGTKERKKANVKPQLVVALTRFINKVTEINDIVKALYNSLPWKVRRFKGRDGKWHDKDTTIQDRIERIYDNLSQLDTGKFIENLIKNELGDAIGGRTGNIQKQAVDFLRKSGLYHRPVGLGTGPLM